MTRFVGSALVRLALVALVLPDVAAHAQGSLSTLGFGYPVGGLSIRAGGTAGAFGEFDAITPHNPAALGGLPRMVVSVQAEPEYRTLRLAGASERTTSQRIPLIAIGFPMRRGFAAGFSAGSFLDRSYTLRTTGSAVIEGATLVTNDVLDVRGAIGDLRAAVGWQVNDRVRVGLGGHLFTGENLVARERTFNDTLSFGSVLDSSRVEYFGTAFSVGGEARVLKNVVGTLSYRLGNGLDARVRDTVRTSANVPDRAAVSLRYDGIRGSVFAVSLEQVSWSKMKGLGSTLTTASDATNWSAGGEVAGPKMRGLPTLVRAGFARSTLPFSVTTQSVKESRWSTGFGLPIAGEGATLDLSLQRATRALSGTGAKESSWLIGVGLQVRP